MLRSRNRKLISIILLTSLLLSTISLTGVKRVSADPGILSWTAVDTPSQLNNVMVSPSEINYIALGSDDRTFYAVDIPDPNGSGSNGRLYKSQDSGITWQNDLSAQLIAAGAFMPIWNIAVAPNDVNFIVAITDGSGALGGPQQVYISTNGGARWEAANSGLSLVPGELISCVDISLTYSGTKHDIAIGTRTGAGGGRVFMMTPGTGNWRPQDALPSTNWPAGGSDVVALKFSPAYASDNSLIVVTSATDTEAHIGYHDTDSNFTAWDGGGYPFPLFDVNFAGLRSPAATEIITADLELPSDFSGLAGARNFYASTDSVAANVQAGVYRINDTVPHRINPPTTGRISSIAYYGALAIGTMLAGEVTDDQAIGKIAIWRSVDCNATTPTWLRSDSTKSPTGGANSSYANAQLAWNSGGSKAYCGTSSADLSVGGTSMVNPGTWPLALTTGSRFDESAFSISPYTPAYELNRSKYAKTIDVDIGNIWNQLSLIDTEIDLLSDVAPLEAPETGENLITENYDVLYLFSINNSALVPNHFDSLWRSTSDPLGRTWERVLCVATSDDDTILRVKQPSYADTDRSQAIVFADRNSDLVGYSPDEGQRWSFPVLTPATDLALTDVAIYILGNNIIYKYVRQGVGWVLTVKVNTELENGHSIAIPLVNSGEEDMVLVGEAGSPAGYGRVIYTDLAKPVPDILPPEGERIAPPIDGDAHVLFDDQFNTDRTIYVATADFSGTSGKIYRWVIDESTAWDELEPPNNAFYGLVQRNDVLYGAWRTPSPAIPEIAANQAGVDRTLNPRVFVPPPPEWDYLVANLPTTVVFNREPSSLKISSNKYNSLWAIDNNNYNYAHEIGRLWGYTDTLSKVGPSTSAPASGSTIPVDPKTGRAAEVNFSWRSLSNVFVYELQLAKDINFTNRVLVNEDITPTSQLAPEVFIPAGALIPVSGSNIGGWANLESGHTYYWRVRARASVTGETVRSPWSATMYFTVEAGLPTASPYPSVILFNPTYGSKNVSNSPGFSWSGMPKTSKYEFILAADPSLQDVIVKTEVPTTSYLYDGKLNYGTTYFWQVRALEPVVSDPSPIGTFTVKAAPTPTTPSVETPTPIPVWVWWIIAVVTMLVASMIAFAMVKPGQMRPSLGGKLIDIKPIEDKTKEPAMETSTEPMFSRLKNAKIWSSMAAAFKKQRFFKKRAEGESGDSQDKTAQ